MKRYLCCLALLGILVIPDWAEACWPMWNRPMPANPLYSYPPVYPPIYVYPTVFPPPGYSIPPANAEISPKITSPKPLPPPVVVPSKTTSSDVPPSPTNPAPTTGIGSSTTKPQAEPTKTEQVRPTGGTDKAASPPVQPKKTELPAAVPDLPSFPAIPGGLPPLELPKEKGSQPPTKGGDKDAPKKTVPSAIPGAAPADPFHAVPSNSSKNGGSIPTIPEPAAPAVPSAAPASLEGLIPTPSLPLMPKSNRQDALPPLTLPPESPVSPPAKSESISRSSPLTAGGPKMTVDVFPVVAMEKAREGYRVVTFFNHTSSDISLNIEGKSVKLPSKTYLNAKLGPAFRWCYGDRPSASERIPDTADGLDIVFRE
jgi:hypothetical protein